MSTSAQCINACLLTTKQYPHKLSLVLIFTFCLDIFLYLSPVFVNESVESHAIFPACGEIGDVYIGVPADTKQHQTNPSATTNFS